MVWRPASRRQWYRLGLVTLALTTVGIAALLGAATTADAQTDLSVGSLNVTGVNDTVSGNVTDATVSATLDYKLDVPDADRRIVRLEAGPTANDTALLDYTQRETDGAATGTVTLSGSLFEHRKYSTVTLTPDRAATHTTQFVVVAEIEVTRSDGDPVTTTVEDTVTLTLADDGTLVADIGGSGEVSIQTDG